MSCLTFGMPAGILRSIILSQLAPHRLAAAPDGPLIPLAGLLEEVAAGADQPSHHGSSGSFDDDLPVSPSQRGSGAGRCGVCEGQMVAAPDSDAAMMREVSSLQVRHQVDSMLCGDPEPLISGTQPCLSPACTGGLSAVMSVGYFQHVQVHVSTVDVSS